MASWIFWRSISLYFLIWLTLFWFSSCIIWLVRKCSIFYCIFISFFCFKVITSLALFLVSSIFFHVRISSYFNSAILFASSYASLSILYINEKNECKFLIVYLVPLTLSFAFWLPWCFARHDQSRFPRLSCCPRLLYPNGKTKICYCLYHLNFLANLHPNIFVIKNALIRKKVVDQCHYYY